MDSPRPRLIGVPEVAESLGVSKYTVYRLLKARTLEGLRIGSKWLVTETALERFVAAKQAEWREAA